MKNWPWYLLSIFVIVVDQLSKYWVTHSLILYHPKFVLPVLNLTLAYNTGVAFSFLSGHTAWLAVLSLVMSVVFVVCIARLKPDEKLQLCAFSLILGGALGNFFDRAFLGYVIDFIDFHIQNHHFAIFNVADSSISIGVVLLVWDALFCNRVSK